MLFLQTLYEKMRKHVHEDPADRLRRGGATIGDTGVHIFDGAGAYIDYDFAHLFTCGHHVTISPSKLLMHDASMGFMLGCARAGRITIGDYVFVGVGCTLLPGVTIGSRVVIGAGSVVTGDIPDNSVAVGSPAKVIGTYDEYIEKCRQDMEKSPHYPPRDKCSPEEVRRMQEEISKYGYLGTFQV
ncbi:MAG: acyltransferase [Lachnospiraceae bacterium]|nr:acyltransferase [Lachnospiraceae bacterium]